MRIGLINGSHQSNKNERVYNSLKMIAEKYGHEVYNFGSSSEENELSYVQSGIYTALLLNSNTVDFVVTGCSSGEGVMLVSNAFPNVTCGHIETPLDAYMFMQINNGNAISIPFSDEIGTDFEGIIENLFIESPGNGYPLERAEIQKKNRIIVEEVRSICKRNFIDIIKDIDKDLIKGIISLPEFKENYYSLSNNEEIVNFIKEL